MNGAVEVAQDERAQVDGLDQAGDVVDARHVAHADLVFENQEEPADDVAHERLRAEAERNTGDARARQERHDVEPELAQDHQQRHREHERCDDVLDELAERARPFRTLQNVEPRSLADLVLGTAARPRRQCA